MSRLSLPAPGPRKAALVSMMPSVALGAEIGADHGITAAHLLAQGLCARMVISDISAASLEKARRLFQLHGLEGRAIFRVADGLAAIREPAQAVLIAGMGAKVIREIMAGGTKYVDGAAWVLQPNRDVEALRAWLVANGYRIVAERIAREARRFYVILRAERGVQALSRRECLLGPCLLRERPEGYLDYLVWRRDCLGRVQKDNTAEALDWIEEELHRDGDSAGYLQNP